jgi:hypothetical protein
VVEVEAQLEQQTPLDVGVFQARVAGNPAHRAEEDRVVLRDLGLLGLGQGLPRGEEALGAQFELRAVEHHVAAGEHGVEHAVGLLDHLGSDTVARKDGELDGAGH